MPIDLQRTHFEEDNIPASPPLHLAMGLGIDVPSFHDGTGTDVEEYYRRMVDENPRNNLFLRNYAQFLHQVNVYSFCFHVEVPHLCDHRMNYR